jgi:selenocysteine-specific elongation factor
MILGTAGHIDHGKTALVRALTGVDTDRLPEEKRRGITIDLGFAPLDIDGVGTIGIVDVPGHEGFIRTMLAGASGIDLAMLVVAADEGVMPQTREHLEILSLLDIPAGVVALTKCDLVDGDWISLVEEDVRSLCAGTMLDDAEIVPVSALSGENLDLLRDAIARAAGRVKRTRSMDVFRMPVDRAFTVKGTGTVVTGTVWSGTITRDMTLRILPLGKDVRVRGVQSHGKSIDTAFPGTRAAIALSGCDVGDVERGATLVSSRDWQPTTELDVSIELTDRNFNPTPRSRVRVHLGTGETGGRLSRLRATGSTSMLCRLVLDEAVVARGRDRFVIRLPSPARTLGGGEVLDPFPPRSKRRQADSGDLSPALTARLETMLEAAGFAGLALTSLPIRTGSSVDEIGNALEQLEATVAADRAFSSRAIAEIEEHIKSCVAVEMANHPLEAGVSLQTLRSSVRAPSAVIDLVLDRLSSGGRVEIEGSLVRPVGWSARLNEREQAASDAILHAICIQPLEPPSTGELESKFGRSTVALLRRLEREGEVERVAEDRYYSRSALAQMVGSLRSSLEPGRPYSPSELRDVLGVSRKYLIPFLEFCDRRGVTERNGAGRVLRTDGAGSRQKDVPEVWE